MEKKQIREVNKLIPSENLNKNLKLEFMKELFQKLENLKSEIKDEESMIEDYESQIDDLREEISDYENEYDYESDPNGNEYDLNYISEKNDEIQIIENLITRCESEIEYTENEIIELYKQISFYNTNPKLNSVSDIRKHFGYISSSNLLKLWINEFGIDEMVNDLKWIYRDDINVIRTILK